MRRWRIVTRNSVYHLVDRRCVAVQERWSGAWCETHGAIGALLQVPEEVARFNPTRLVGTRAALMLGNVLCTTSTVVATLIDPL